MNRFLLGFLGLIPTVALSGMYMETIPYGAYPCEPDCFTPYGYNPPVNYLGGGDNGFFGAIELLYFRADPRIDYAAVVELNTINISEKANRIRSKFYWDPGIRLTLGYDLPCDQWAITGDYTYFRTSDIEERGGVAFSGTESGVYIVPAIGPFLQNIPFLDTNSRFFESQTKVQFRGHLNLNQFTIALDRKCYVTPTLTFDPYAGFKGLYIHQHYETLSLIGGTTSGLGSGPFNATDFFKALGQFNGYGAVIGIKTFWNFLSDLSLYADFGTSLLSSRSRWNFKWVETLLISSSEVTPLTPPFAEGTRLDEVTYTFDGAVALYWNQSLNCGGTFTVKLGWEGHYISDQNRIILPNVPYDIQSKPLTLQGLVFGLGFSI